MNGETKSDVLCKEWTARLKKLWIYDSNGTEIDGLKTVRCSTTGTAVADCTGQAYHQTDCPDCKSCPDKL